MMYTLMSSDRKNKDSIREHLARLVISGELKTEDILPNEVALADKFGVSRTLIRDVLRSLEEKGLIERKPQVGTRPRNIQYWNLLDDEVLAWCCESMPQRRFYVSLLELRMVIEPQAAALAATRANDEEIQQIVNAFNRMTSKNQNGVMIDSEGDIDFHQAIIKASGNIFISQFGGIVRAALYHTIYMSVRAATDHAESIESHRLLLEAIERRNPEQSYMAMSRVLSRTMLDMGIEKASVILPNQLKPAK